MHSMLESIVFLNQCKVELSGYALNGCIWRVWVTDYISMGANVVMHWDSACDIMNN